MPASTTSLTDRYVQAAMRTVPERQRADLTAELTASIQDSIDARTDTGDDPDAAERAVLTALGDPDRLAAGYTDRLLYLIGPRFYLDWWRLLKLLLWIVLPCAAFGVALGKVLGGATVGEVIGTTVTTTGLVAIHLCFWSALVFAVLERVQRRGFDPVEPWSLERLPEQRDRGAGFGDMLAMLVWLLVAAGAVVWDHTIGLAWGHAHVSFLDAGLWPWWIGGLFALLAAKAVIAVAVYLRGRWTIASAAGNAVLNVAIAVPALALLISGRLIDPGFFAAVFPGANADLARVLTTIAGFAIVLVGVWDTADAFLKAARARAARAGS